MARNRYGWQKRAKEMARKEKNDEKMKRRQGKSPTLPTHELAKVLAEPGPGEGDPVRVNLQIDS